MEPKVAEITLAKATIFNQGEFGMGIRKFEARNVRVEILPYAQYANAVSIKFVRKGERREREIVETTHAATVILAGWGHDLTPDEMCVPVGAQTPEVQVLKGRYRSCDSRWVSDFMASLAAYVSTTGAEIALNCVGHVVVEKTRNMTGARGNELHTLAWQWAEKEVATHGRCWEPTAKGARELGAVDAEEVSHVLHFAQAYARGM